ncbi:MAG: hypothetical protein EZS28_027221 [Streblomastix strix]|uniref:DDE-1 domain-containing protein n=1 Tax=Streblomastix strix TaxID=222440 RepID=A0A5J4V429_9EUKA|nr:MAG: hypothetical protein EZS28_027221 [Streblomastix strix]
MIKYIIPQTIARRKEIGKKFTQHALLLPDSHSSRQNPAVRRPCQKAIIDVITFQSHTTHIYQTCDCSVFKAFRKAVRENFELSEDESAKSWRAAICGVVADPNIDVLEGLPETLSIENTIQLRQWKRKNIPEQPLTDKAYPKQWEREVKDAEQIEKDVEEDSDSENSEE